MSTLSRRLSGHRLERAMSRAHAGLSGRIYRVCAELLMAWRGVDVFDNRQVAGGRDAEDRRGRDTGNVRQFRQRLSLGRTSTLSRYDLRVYLAWLVSWS